MPPSAICELPSGLWDDDAGGAWLPDGTIVFSNGNTALFKVSAQGGDPVEMLKPDPKKELHFHAASALPDGKGILYVVHRAEEGKGNNTIAVWSGGKVRYVLEAAGQAVDDVVYSPTGHLLFERAPTNAGVWALPFSLSDLKATGEPFLVSPGMRAPSVASDGTLVVLPRAPGAPGQPGLGRSGRESGLAARRSGAAAAQRRDLAGRKACRQSRSSPTENGTSGSTTSNAARAAASRPTAKPPIPHGWATGEALSTPVPTHSAARAAP